MNAKYPSTMTQIKRTIPGTEDESGVANMADFTLVKIRVPADMTGAKITLLGGTDAASLAPIYDAEGEALERDIPAAGGIIQFDANTTIGLQFFAVKSDENESASREIEFIGYRFA